MPLPPRKWRVFTYIVGDQEGLPQDEAEQIDAVATAEAKKMVRAARGNDDMCLAVYVDLTLKQGGQLYIVPPKPGNPNPIDSKEEQAGLKGIVRFVQTTKPLLPEAEHTMVILWGHGGGPLGLFSDPDGGSGKKGKGQLTLPQLRDVLNAAYADCGGKPLDILLVKSCYVATLEVAREIDKFADYVICSQARVPLRTWSVWEEIFDQLTGSPKDSANEIIRAIAEHYQDVVERNDRDEIPFSLLRPSAVQSFVEEPMAQLSKYLRDHRDDERIAAAIEAARPAVGGDKALLDVRNLCANLINVDEPELTTLASKVDCAVAGHLVVTNTPAESAFGGVGVFHFPRDPLLRVESFANEVTDDLYSDLLFAKRTAWDGIALSSHDEPPLPSASSCVDSPPSVGEQLLEYVFVTTKEVTPTVVTSKAEV